MDFCQGCYMYIRGMLIRGLIIRVVTVMIVAIGTLRFCTVPDKN